MICDNFFARYTRLLFQDHHNGPSATSRASSSSRRSSRRIDVRCQVSELDGISGQVRRRRLARLCEEENADYDERRRPTISRPRLRTAASEARADDFRLFIRSQTLGGGRRLTEIRQDSGASCGGGGSTSAASSSPLLGSASSLSLKLSQDSLSGAKQADSDEVEHDADADADDDDETTTGGEASSDSGASNEAGESIRCYELFCVHQQSLLVHRDQVLVEAERLAKRLSASLLP